MVNQSHSRLVRQKHWMQKCWRYSVLGLAIALLCIGHVSGHGLAQDSEPTPDSEPTASPEVTIPLPENPLVPSWQNLAPPEIRALFESRGAEAELATIYLDGRALFEVTAPIEGGTWTAADRAHEIQQRLKRIAIQEMVSSDSLNNLVVDHELDTDSNQPVVYVNGEPLMTVTFLDAMLDGSNNLSLQATQIAKDVEDALTRYYLERQSDFLWERGRWTAVAILLTLLMSFALAHYYDILERRRQRLKEGQTEQAAIANPYDMSGTTVTSRVHTTVLTQQQVKSLKVYEQVLQMGQVTLWGGSLFLVLGFFPYTRWLQPVMIQTLRLPLRFILIALIAYGFIRFTDVWVDRVFLAVQTKTALTMEKTQRLALRLSTFSEVIKGCVTFLVGIIAGLIILSSLGVQVTPVLAGAGLVGVALSFASQSLIKDIINGFLILFEDQYGVGDVISVQGVTGFVETMNLRITQLRDTEGRLTTVPNGQIDIVQNLSKEWSRVDLGIPVGLETDINQAMRLVEQVAHEMSQDGIWGPLILEPPLLLGVDSLDHLGATVRIWIKTQPLKQWDVAREYRRRLKLAFEAARVPIGVPQQIVHVSRGSGNTTIALSKPSTSGNGAVSEAPDLTSTEPHP